MTRRHRRRPPRLRPTDYRLYELLRSDLLDFRDFRPVKAAWVARRIGVSRSAVTGGFLRLEGWGALERAPRPYLTALSSFRLGPTEPSFFGGMRV